ncbi:4'-phosphopantetheinyl transferase family protein [Streptacidiphilus monticola]|uniref:4'-phosphopantetheinyl transferase family protein n=1 Tax=Streptacidiphilus monticola TaxID=2161674 RepID=A0ABW1FUF8_9ACTN
MTASTVPHGPAATGPAFGPLIRIAGRSGPWPQIRADLDRYGTALVYARTEDWRPDQAAGPRLKELLGRQDWERYLEQRHPGVRSRFAASRVLLKYAAGAALQVPPDRLELGYLGTGRPYLRGNDSLDISLSHTDGLLLVGLTSRGAIGVDVEDAHRRFHEAGLARHWCSAEESARVDALPAERRDPELVRLWTLKESYSKALGVGMQFRFTDFTFAEEKGRLTVRSADRSSGGEDAWAFGTWTVGADYAVAVAVRSAGFGRTDDTAAHTMLDPSFMDAVAAVLADDPDDDTGGPGSTPADDDW